MIIRTTSFNKDFIHLVKMLDAELTIRDGELHDFYDQFNGTEELNHVVVMYNENRPVACGAFKNKTKHTAELKRMFTHQDERAKGHASIVLKELETWALELGITSILLETGTSFTDAVTFYTKHNYQQRPNYEPYVGVETSLCFEKSID
jgi:putative acetyltransferase